MDMASASYTSDHITVLEGLEPVRRRPGMYIGGTDSKGYHHLLWEIVDNSVDEVINGYGSRIEVTLHKDGKSVTVEDDGRGIPIDIKKQHKKSALELVLTTLHAGGKFGASQYEFSGGLHGVGSSVVNALSEEMVAQVKRDSTRWEQTYERGKATSKLKKVGPARGTGTKIMFRPDPQIFGKQQFSAETIRFRLDAKAFLHKGLTIAFTDEGREDGRDLRAPGRHRRLPDQDDHRARQAADRAAGLLLRAPGREGVPHRGDVAVDRVARGDDPVVCERHPDHPGRDARAGVPGGDRQGGARVHRAREPGAQGRHADRRGHPRGRRRHPVDVHAGAAVPGSDQGAARQPGGAGAGRRRGRPALERFLLENRTAGAQIVERIALAAKAREASRAAAQAVSRKTAVSHRLNLPGKLADCASTDPGKSELFIVEGQSAGGTAKQGRERKTQAILRCAARS
jgi:DNA gyrase subunit B/topoisomerase-4 subunit B